MPRSHPVLPDKKRAHRDVARPDQISMQGVWLPCALSMRTQRVLADEQQPLLWAVAFVRVATQRTPLAGIVGIHLDGKRGPRQGGFVGDHAVQFSKGPLRGMAIGPARFLGDGFGALPVAFAPSPAPLCPLANAGEFFQTDQGVGVRLDNLFRDGVVGLPFQPSLSPAQCDLASRGGASAFFLQALPQPGIVISPRPDSLSWVKVTLVARGCRGCQIA